MCKISVGKIATNRLTKQRSRTASATGLTYAHTDSIPSLVARSCARSPPYHYEFTVNWRYKCCKIFGNTQRNFIVEYPSMTGSNNEVWYKVTCLFNTVLLKHTLSLDVTGTHHQTVRFYNRLLLWLQSSKGRGSLNPRHVAFWPH